jgi:hypothetical protein
MADLTVHVTQTCATNRQWSLDLAGTTGTHTVRFGFLVDGPYQYGWSCSCKGFRFRGSCSHINKVRASGVRCAWNAELELSQETACPDCGGPVIVEQVGA